MGNRRGQKQETRERVLKAAAAAIRSQGAARISVGGIMSEVGLTHGGFYNHFPSRDDFIADAIDQMFSEWHEALRRLTVAPGPAEGLAAYIDFYLSPAHWDKLVAGCPVPFVSSDAPRLSSRARQRFASGVAGVIAVLADLFERLGRAEPGAEALSLFSELAGAVTLARAEPDPEAARAMLARTKIMLRRKLGLREPARRGAPPLDRGKDRCCGLDLGFVG
jgi:TetR/AcrR family transcriptional repressor of nem operon